MALTSAGIERARDILNNITINKEEFTYLKQVSSFMQNDQDFNTFLQGTTFGQETYQKWQNLVDLINVNLYKCLSDIYQATTNFVNEQEVNNKGSFSGRS